MEFTETISVTDPKSGRMCQVYLTDNEVTQLLTIAANICLVNGVVRIREQAQLDGSIVPVLEETRGTAQ